MDEELYLLIAEYFCTFLAAEPIEIADYVRDEVSRENRHILPHIPVTLIYHAIA